MLPKTLGRAGVFDEAKIKETENAYNPIALAKFKNPLSVSTAGELKPEMITFRERGSVSRNRNMALTLRGSPRSEVELPPLAASKAR
jgi:hypothetical protein